MLDIQDNHDGYHTFRELYAHRVALFLFIVNQNKDNFVKSRYHADGSPSYENWFLVQGYLPNTSLQISYHIPNHMWSNFKCQEVDTPPLWDKHSSNDVVERLIDVATNYLG